MATRAAESAAAFAGLPHRVSTLPLLEAQYAGVRNPGDSATVERAIRAWAQGNPGGLVALPAGAGRRSTGLIGRLVSRKRIRTHPDHLFVRDAALAALDEQWTPLLYEELPYLAGGSANEEVERLAAALDRKAVLAEPAVDRTQKASRIAAFRSQVRLISPPEMPLDEPPALPAIERYWLLER
jgi:hypothetical protein